MSPPPFTSTKMDNVRHKPSGKVSAPFFFNQGLYETDRFLRLLLEVWVVSIHRNKEDYFALGAELFYNFL